MRRFGKRHFHSFLCFALIIAIIAATAATERSMGRSWFGPDGTFGLWAGDIWSNENSQRLADPYSFSHIGHGILFYGLFHVLARRLPVRWRLVMAALLEAGWEILENSPVMIERYRAVTISLGYTGDSILNSLSDIAMMGIGFTLASRAKPWVSLLVLCGMEIGCAWWIRDNLTLNVLMLIHPVEGIRQWQAAGHR